MDNDIWLLSSVGESLEAKLITFGGHAYPKEGQVLILAGGAGSGKGFQLSRLIGIEGKVFDVDKFKEMAVGEDVSKKKKELFRHFLMKHPPVADYVQENHIDFDKLNLKDPKDVSVLHHIIKLSGLDDEYKDYVSRFSDSKTKPNLIFDKTCKSRKDLQEVFDTVVSAGYKKENIHLVWVVNDLNVAVVQNRERSRTIDEELLRKIHAGVSRTMNELIRETDGINQYVGGDVWISFNKEKVDVELLIKQIDDAKTQKKKNLFVVTKSSCVLVKKKGKKVDLSKFNQTLSSEMMKVLKDKLSDYTKDDVWKASKKGKKRMNKILVAKELVRIARKVLGTDDAEFQKILAWRQKSKNDFISKFGNDAFYTIYYSVTHKKYKVEFTYNVKGEDGKDLSAAKNKMASIAQYIENAVKEFKRLFPNETIVW